MGERHRGIGAKVPRVLGFEELVPLSAYEAADDYRLTKQTMIDRQSP